MSLGPRDAAAMVRIEMAQHDYQLHRDKYERLRSDVTIKLKFLEENKVCLPSSLKGCVVGIQDPVVSLLGVASGGTEHTFDHTQPWVSVLKG